MLDLFFLRSGAQNCQGGWDSIKDMILSLLMKRCLCLVSRFKALSITMASCQHTQVRDWAVQHWKNPGHTVRAPEFQVSSSLGLQLLLSWQRVQGNSHWSSPETVYSTVHDWETYSQCVTRTQRHTLEHSIQETCFSSTKEDKRREDESFTARTFRNSTKESWVSTLQLFRKELIFSGFLSNDF